MKSEREESRSKWPNQRKLAVAAGSAAVGLAGLAYEMHRRRVAKPESLLDPKIATYRGGAVLKVAAALLGGGDLVPRSEIEAATGLNERHVSVGLNFLKEHGLAVSGLFGTPVTERETHFQIHCMVTPELLRAVTSGRQAYRAILEQASEYYPEFDADELSRRVEDLDRRTDLHNDFSE